MKTTKRVKPSKVRRVTTTVGDLIAAAYEASRGREGARRLLTRSPLARVIQPHLKFV